MGHTIKKGGAPADQSKAPHDSKDSRMGRDHIVAHSSVFDKQKKDRYETAKKEVAQ